ncbi:MAG: sigma 54-interacting transcriptional regulator [Chromatiales bacterium]
MQLEIPPTIMLKVLKQQRDLDRAALREIGKIVRAAGDPWAAARRVLAVLSTHFGVHAGAVGLVHETRAPHKISAARLLPEKPRASDRLEQVIGQGPRARRVLEEIKEAAAARSAVLLSGAGAVETAARAIHAMSARSHGPFVPLDCIGWTDSQLGHELFGHAAGSAARQGCSGCCERARGGTLFLDGIHALPWSAQTKLLRLLEHREFVPVGASAPMPADLRVIAGTGRNLEQAVATGAFRADLYFRLRALTVSLPPLHATAHRDVIRHRHE